MATIVDGLRRSRVLRLLLAVVFVPLVLLAQTKAADAALAAPTFRVTVERPWSTDMHCGGTYSVGRHGTFMVPDGWCDGGVFSGGAPESGSWGYVAVRTSAGASCYQESIQFKDHTKDRAWNSWGSFSTVGIIDKSCLRELTLAVCVGIGRQGTDEYGSREGCATINYPAEAADCLDGVRVYMPEFRTIKQRPDLNGRYQHASAVVRFKVENDSSMPHTFFHYVMVTGPDVNAPGFRGVETHSPLFTMSPYQHRLNQNRETTVTVQPYTTVEVEVMAALGDQVRMPDGGVAVRDLVGAGIARVTPGVGSPASWGTVPVTPTNPLYALTGRHQPTACSYYYGEQLWEDTDPLGGPDVPGGPLTGGDRDQHVPNPDAAPGDEWYPQNDDEFRAGVWDWLRDLWEWLKGLPGKIADAIGDMLRSLFVPSEGFLQEQAERLQEALGGDGDGVGAWTDQLGNVLPSEEASRYGCEGPEFSFEASGVEVEGRPLDACSGTGALLASVSRAFIYGTVGLGGLLACVRALGSGFGWRPGVGESA